MISSVLVSVTVDIRHFLSFNNILTTKLSLDGTKSHQTDSHWARFKKKSMLRDWDVKLESSLLCLFLCYFFDAMASIVLLGTHKILSTIRAWYMWVWFGIFIITQWWEDDLLHLKHVFCWCSSLHKHSPGCYDPISNSWGNSGPLLVRSFPKITQLLSHGAVRLCACLSAHQACAFPVWHLWSSLLRELMERWKSRSVFWENNRLD